MYCTFQMLSKRTLPKHFLNNVRCVKNSKSITSMYSIYYKETFQTLLSFYMESNYIWSICLWNIVHSFNFQKLCGIIMLPGSSNMNVRQNVSNMEIKIKIMSKLFLSSYTYTWIIILWKTYVSEMYTYCWHLSHTCQTRYY